MTTLPQHRTKKKPAASFPTLTRPLNLRMDSPTEEVRIEIVPLIDVIFCILTFFILAAVGLSRQQAINVDLPKASTGTAQGRQILMISLDELGQVYVEKNPVITQEQFIQQLQAYKQQNPSGVFVLYASPNAMYNEVVQILDLLREVGGDRVALANSPGQSPQIPGTNPLSPSTGVPEFNPNPGQIPVNPDSTFNPNFPQFPGVPGQPQFGSPPTNPGTLPPSPGQFPINPGGSVPPNLGTPTSPQPQGE
ncbi:biopolymer transporter ExbD [Coleofasciculus sp. G2-EDA-02]|uniref:biopolymer transporter ExbD n=1 Tax=Coleofasciculus sp. G2-EDA-02 TaxID=3069529 RepID=UPI0032F9CEB1